MLVYGIQFARTAERELGAIRAYDGRRILATIDLQLAHHPAVPTRNRKMLEGVRPTFAAVPPVWELRVGEYRVFYDVNDAEQTVFVRAVRRKPPGRSTEEIA